MKSGVGVRPRAQLSPAPWRLKGRRAGDEALDLILLSQNSPSLSTSTLTHAASCRHCFPFLLPPPSLPFFKFFLFLKKTAPGRRSPAAAAYGCPACSARRHQSREPLPREGGRSMGKFKLPSCQKGAWSGASWHMETR